jgi:topoisomerase-4 subunit A
VVYYDSEQELYYVKRFEIDGDIAINRPQNFIGDNPENKLISITWVHYPRLEIEFGGKNSDRDNEIIEVAEFIGIKSYKAKGKRLSNFEVKNIKEIEPVVKDEDEKQADEDIQPENQADDIPFEIDRGKPDDSDDDEGQMSLFDND